MTPDDSRPGSRRWRASRTGVIAARRSAVRPWRATGAPGLHRQRLVRRPFAARKQISHPSPVVASSGSKSSWLTLTDCRVNDHVNLPRTVSRSSRPAFPLPVGRDMARSSWRRRECGWGRDWAPSARSFRRKAQERTQGHTDILEWGLGAGVGRRFGWCYQRGGRRSFQGRACSSWADREISVPSSAMRPASMMPIGRPSAVQCSGTLTAGWPDTL